MEAALVAPALVAVSFARTSARIGRAVLGSPHDLTTEWTPILSRTQSYLNIIDVPLTGTGPVTPVLLCKVDDTKCKQETITDALTNLTEQGRTHIRIYIEENLVNNKVFIDHVTRKTSQRFADEYRHPATSSFLRIQAQCRDAEAGQWWGNQSFHHLGIPDDHALTPGMAAALDALLVRCSKRIRIVTDSESRLLGQCVLDLVHSCFNHQTVFVSCASTVSHSKTLLHATGKLDRLFMTPSQETISVLVFGPELKREVAPEDIESWSRLSVFALLEAIGRRIIDDDFKHRPRGTMNLLPEDVKQMVFLRLIHSFLAQFSEYLDVVEMMGNHPNTTHDVLGSSSIRGISQETQFYEELRSSLNSITATTEGLLQLLTASLGDIKPLRIFATTLRVLSHDNTRRITRLSERLDARVKYIQLYKSVSDASRTGLISILASIFLPLSLACGILSMQTRLNSLHFLLYNFCGLLVIFGTIAIVILMCARAYSSWRESIAQRNHVTTFKERRPLVEFIIGGSALLGWGLCTASFLVGMIKNVGLSLKILGFGTAGLVALTLLILLITSIYWNVHYRILKAIARFPI